MQNYAESHENGNIFRQFSDWRKKSLSALSHEQVKRLVSLRNDKTHADEMMLLCWGIILILTCFTAYCDWLFYTDTFSRVFSPTATWLAAIAIVLVVEVTKIIVAHRLVRAIFFGWMFRKGWAFFAWIFVAALAIGAFKWSISVSTDGMSMLTKQVTEASTRANQGTLEDRVAAATAEIDAQIATASGQQAEAMNTKWKGTTTRDGQKIADKTAASISSLQQQRQQVVDATIADYQSRELTRQGQISNWAYWIEEYGGKAQIACILCLLAVGFFERQLASQNLKDLNEDPPHPTPDNSDSERNKQSRPYPAYNGHQRQPESGIAHNTTTTTISPVRAPQTLTGEKIATSDTDSDFIAIRLKRLRGWCPLFGRPGNKTETVAQNMVSILLQVQDKFSSSGFSPEVDVVAAFFDYIKTTAIPALQQNGYDYRYESTLLLTLENYLTIKHSAAA